MSIKERVGKKEQGWNEIFFTKGGKRSVDKSSGPSNTPYTMSVFKLPSTLCENLSRAREVRIKDELDEVRKIM